MSRGDLKAWVPLGVLAAALLIMFIPLLIGQRVLFWGLPALQFYPWRAFAFDELSAGRIPFWNPYNGGGAPLLANYQTAVFYPPNWLHFFIHDGYTMSLLAVLHVFWGGLGMWMFTGQLGVIPLGRGISTISFALGGYGIARMGSFPTADAVAWMPWLLWAVLCVLEKRKLVYAGLLSLITAMLLLTGHAQTAFYVLVAAGIFALWVSVRFLGEAAGRLHGFILTGIGVLLGASIASVQLLFTFELLAQSQRSGGVDYETLTNLSFAPLRVLTWLAPKFLGTPVDGSYLTPGRGVFFEDAIYIGFLPLLSALSALVGWIQWRSLLIEPRRAYKSVPLWSVLVVVGFLLAVGKYSPLYRWLYDHVPTFDAFREPVRWMLLPVFALSVLAGIGVQNWRRSPRLFFWTRLAAVGGAALAVLAFISAQIDRSGNEFVPVLTQAMMAMGSWLVGACLLTLGQPDEVGNTSSARWQLAVLIFVAADLGWAAQGLNPTVPDEFYREVSLTEPQQRLYWFEDYEDHVKFETYFDLSDYRKATRDWPDVRRSLLPNLNMLDRVLLFNNFDPLKPRYHVRYVELIEAQGEKADRLLRAAAVGQTFGEVQPRGWQAEEGDIPSYIAPAPPPLAWMVPRAVWAADNAAVEAALLSENWLPEETVILSAEAPPAGELSPPFTQVSFFEVLEDSPDQKSYRVVTDGSGYLVLANTWYPGWQVSVDGEERPLYRANLSFMAVYLPAGGGEVTFRYVPTISWLSILLSFAAIFFTLILITVGLVRQTDSQPIPLEIE